MRRCILCHYDRADQAFSKGNPVCRKCVHTLKDKYSVDYSLPQKVTVLEGCIKLLGAIRDQAIIDSALEEWEDYWINSKGMQPVWMLLREGGFSRDVVSSPALAVVYSDDY